MEYKLNDYKLSKEEFEKLSIVEKRNYIIQTDVEETNWWLRTMTKIYVVGFIFLIFLTILLMMNKR